MIYPELKNKLLPCPFCGGEATIDEEVAYSVDSSYLYVGCKTCPARIPFDFSDFPEQIVEQWNRRDDGTAML